MGGATSNSGAAGTTAIGAGGTFIGAAGVGGEGGEAGAGEKPSTSGGSAGTAGGAGTGNAGSSSTNPPLCESGETCDGVDNDCDGVIDNLGEFTCGLGACQRTVAACTGGVLGVCVPAAPTTTLDDCNGIDDDCDGAVDEDCAACIHVALDGDDVLAASNAAATPFQTLQAALDFAAAHREIAPRVCVAAGPTCGASATYSSPAGADLTMHDGIELLANYESTHFTRCADSTTEIVPTTARGVVFPSDIVVGSNLDGFTLHAAYDPTHAVAVTVDGASGVMLSNLTLVDVGRPSSGGPWTNGSVYGVDVVNGATATVTRSRIIGTASIGDSAAVHASDARVFVEDNCSGPLDPTTGRCTGACGTAGAEISEGFSNLGIDYAILLENSPGSRVERNTICGVQAAPEQGDTQIEVKGAAKAVQIRANTLGGPGNAGGTSLRVAGIQLEDCGDAAPWIVDNEAIAVTGANVAIRAVGACHPVIESNQAIASLNVPTTGFYATAISCEAGTVPSRCVIADNASIIGDIEQQTTSGQNSATGIACRAGSCARISKNQIWGIKSSAACTGGACQRYGYGLIVDGGSPVISDNVISAGSASGLTGAARFFTSGVEATGTATFLGNQIAGGFSGAAAELRANTLTGSSCDSPFGPTPAIQYSCYGIAWSGGGKLVDNCIDASICACSDVVTAPSAWAAFYENGPDADPLVFENNQLNFPGSPLYLDEGTTPLTAAQVNALTDMTVSGTLSGSCTAPPDAQ
jgi:hypothetical protein